MRTGLVSITFRQLPPGEIVELAVRSGLECIEWGGDVHAPHGDVDAARRVGGQTRAAGLSVAAYGSYYRLDESERGGLPFERVLASAVELGAPTIRVWAGRREIAAADPDHLARAAEDALRIADRAQSAGLSISYEYHRGTLTDSPSAARELLRRTVHPAIFTLWQPPHGEPLDFCVDSLRDVLPRLHHLHVFHWWPDGATKLPLLEGSERWERYLEVLREAGADPDLLLEFVPGNDPDVLAREAGTLRKWVQSHG